MTMQEALVGKIITAYNLSQDDTEITFNIFGHDSVTLKTEGDCCSHTWIESIDTPDNLFGIVTAVQDIDMPKLGDIKTLKCPHPECIKYYGLRITTTKGTTVIDYRNNSNGYYGGSLYLVEK